VVIHLTGPITETNQYQTNWHGLERQLMENRAKLKLRDFGQDVLKVKNSWYWQNTELEGITEASRQHHRPRQHRIDDIEEYTAWI